MTPAEIAQGVVDQLARIKEQIEADPGGCDDRAWQFASGQVRGARLVLAAIRESGGSVPADQREAAAYFARMQAEAEGQAPVLNKSGGSEHLAAFVVRDADGLENFACAKHAQHPRWVRRVPLAQWFEAAHLPVPDDGRRCMAWVTTGEPEVNKSGGCSLGAEGCDRDHGEDTPAPEVNKSGGSDVEGECPCMKNDHFAGLTQGQAPCACLCHPNNRR